MSQATQSQNLSIEPHIAQNLYSLFIVQYSLFLTNI